jgi:DNA-binding IclR family transcriptional regulator
MASKSKTLATVHNALALLDAFSIKRPEWGIRELSRAYSLPQATTSRLVGTLCNEGFLARTPEKRYRLDMALHEIGVSAARGSDLYAIALPELVRVRCASGLATTLSVLDGVDAVFLERLGECDAEALRSPRKRWPAYATSAGKAMLAFGPQTLVDDVLRSPQEACTPYTLTVRSALVHALEGIRADGFATDIEESQIGWHGLAVPIMNGDGAPVGALAVEQWQQSWTPATSAQAVSLLRGAAKVIGAEFP